MARRNPKPGPGHFHGSGQYVKKIIKCLEKVNALSGYHAFQIFDDWSQLVETCLEALPTHLTSIARTGSLAADTAEAKQVFERIRGRYQRPSDASETADVWQYFSQAFAILLESAEPGLWGPGSYGHFDVGYLGPDVIGHTYILYATPNRAKSQIFTPWNLALMAGRLTIPKGERQVHDRVKEACLHPDNILAQAALLAGLAIAQPEQARAWFFRSVLPASRQTYKPLIVGDPAGCGSGVMLLAAAACFPEWAVRLNCVIFQGVDIDPVCVRLAKINCMLYSLNGYYLKFAEALHALTNQAANPSPPVRSPTDAYRQAVTTYKEHSSAPTPAAMPTFADLFRRPIEIECED